MEVVFGDGKPFDFPGIYGAAEAAALQNQVALGFSGLPGFVLQVLDQISVSSSPMFSRTMR